MSQIRFDAFDEEDKEIMKKVNLILSIPQAKQNPHDKLFIDYLKYIFSNEFIEFNISSINKNKEKNAYKYLKNYIQILSVLFKKDKTEREALYQDKESNLGNELSNLFSSLKLFRKRMNILFNPDKLNDKVFIFFYTYFLGLTKTLSGSLTFFFYCLGFMIPKLNTLKLLLYNFLKEQFPAFLKKFDFKEFCPDLQNNNCLNLILLYVENIAKNNLEILFIYALLISKYEYIFRSFEKDIDAKILEKSVEQTLVIVKKKTIDNQVIGMYIYSYFHYYLQGNLESQENDIETENSNNSINEDIYDEEKNEENINNEVGDKNEIKEENPQYTQSKDINKSPKETSDKKSIIISCLKENTNNENKEIVNVDNKNGQILINNVKKDNDIFPCDNSPKINMEDIDTLEKNSVFVNQGINIESQKVKERPNQISSKEKNIKAQNNKKTDILIGNNSQIEGNSEDLKMEETQKSSKGKENFMSSKAEEKNVDSREIKENVIYSNSSGSKSTKVDLNYESNNTGDNFEKINDSNNNEEEKIFTDLEQISVIEIMNKKFNDMNGYLQKKFKTLTTEINTLKEEIKSLKTILGSIQVRDYAKKFMNQFKYLLNKVDKKNIKKNKEDKWKIIRRRIQNSFQKYESRPKYESFIELIKKSERVIKNGNKEAHNINLKIYEKDIIEIAEKNQFIIPNSNKLFFLIQLGVSEDSFKDGYQFLDSYFDDNLERRFLKDSPMENFFN